MHRLTHFRLCPVSRATRIAMAEMGRDFVLAEERPWEGRPQFLALNPAGELPILAFADGPTILGGYAITEYLAALPPALDGAAPPIALFPGDLDEQAEVRRLVDWFHHKLDREVTRELLYEKVYARLRNGGNAHAPEAAILRAVRANLLYHLRYLNFLCDQRRWLAGEVMSYADMAAAAHLSVIDYLDELSFEGVPAAKAWYARFKSRPSMRAILADRMPGQPPPEHYANLDF